MKALTFPVGYNGSYNLLSMGTYILNVATLAIIDNLGRTAADSCFYTYQ